MPLREELLSTGRFLFRWRSYPPLAVLAVVVAQLLGADPSSQPRPSDLRWEALCLALAVLGLSIRAYVAGHVPRGTSGRNTRDQICERLNTTGAYSVVRHPLYLGNFFIWLGVSLFPRVPWLVAVVAMVFWLYYERIMYAEEELLRDRFGEAYLRWGMVTPAFFPRFKRFEAPTLPFSVRTVLRREPSSWLGVTAAFLLLRAAGERVWEPVVSVMFASSAFVYLVLRSLKRSTRVLEVEGR